MKHLVHRGRRDGGWVSAFVVVIVLLCGAIAAASVFQNVGARREAETLLARERAFQAAEAGVDWGLMRLRVSHGATPSPATESVAVDGTARFTLNFGTGRTNGVDDDGDAAVDEADESDWSVVSSTGESNGVRRTLQILLRRVVSMPTFPAATHIADATPVFSVAGNAFTVDGRDHFMDGTVDGSRAAKFGVSSPANPAVLSSQIPANRAARITGLGGLPSVGQSSAIDLNTLIDQAKNAATVVIPSGTLTGGNWGTPTANGVAVVRCDGDVHLSGSATGAGILVIEGDLVITGRLSWVGIILVRGGVRFSGGGNTNRLIGAIACADELSNDTVTFSGTIDVLYSSDAVGLASQALSVPVPVSWRETGSPSP